MAKEEQKKLLTEIMDADAKDGLYKQQTAVERFSAWRGWGLRSTIAQINYEL